MLKVKSIKRINGIRIGRLSRLQLQLFCFIIFVLVGSLYANFILRHDIDNYQLIFEFFKNKMIDSNIIKNNLFEFIIVNRVKLYLFLWIVGFTLFAYYIDLAVTAYFGFSFGTIFSMAVIYKGFSMYLLILLLLVPQYIVYIPVYIYLIKRNTEFSKDLYRNRKTSKTFRINTQLLIEYFLVLIICLLFIIVGTFCEAFINPEVIKWYLLLKN